MPSRTSPEQDRPVGAGTPSDDGCFLEALCWDEGNKSHQSSREHEGRGIPADVPQSQSKLSRHYASFKSMTKPEARASACLEDLVDGVLQSQHQVSQRYRPSPEAVLAGVPHALRHDTLDWMVQAFHVVSFPDSVIFDTSLLLDRYYSSLAFVDSSSDGPTETQIKLLAAVCISLKAGAPAETHVPVRNLIDHLGRYEVPFEKVVHTELDMLRELKFRVGTPNARDFLEALSVRLYNRLPGVWWHLAEFLLQLSLGDVVLHYQYPHSVLAASVLCLALHATRASQGAQAVILEDLALHCPDAVTPYGILVKCAGGVHSLWLQSLSNEQSLFQRHLCVKFARPSRDQVALLVPPSVPLTSLPIMSVRMGMDTSRSALLGSMRREGGRLSTPQPQVQERVLPSRQQSWAFCPNERNTEKASQPLKEQDRPCREQEKIRRSLAFACGLAGKENMRGTENLSAPLTANKQVDSKQRCRAASWSGQRASTRKERSGSTVDLALQAVELAAGTRRSALAELCSPASQRFSRLVPSVC